MRTDGFEHREHLEVRLVRPEEVGRFNDLLDEHHFLGHHLFGRVVRYVALEQSEWVALVGFGSAALSLGAREAYVGWSEATRLRRLRYVSNNQRFCVLPDARRPNLASAVLARTLRRLSSDVEATYGHPVLLVETFTDPARHAGTCYRAANFHPVGLSSGYGRRNGAWVHHGHKKMCWLYPLRADAPGLLAAPFDHPALAPATTRSAGVPFDLNRVVIDGEAGLFARLAELPDHRKAKGVRHQLASILLVCAAAMLCGNHNPTEIAEWAGDLPDELRGRLHCRRSPTSGRLVTPSTSTIQRTLRNVDREALDRIICEVLAEQVAAARAARAGDVAGDADGGAERARSDDPDPGEQPDEPGQVVQGALRGIAVDGKSLRGALCADGRCMHLLAAATHDERVVIAQQEVDHKVNEIKLFRPLLENLDIDGALVTADAMHTQRDHARFLVEEKNAHFLLFVKENQPSVYNEVVCRPAETFTEAYSETCNGHGRAETRSIQVSPTPAGLVEFPHVAAVARIDRSVHDSRTGELRWSETAWAVTSADGTLADPARLLGASRDHWSIENGLHWVRDATMREDASKVRSGSAPRALATMRNLVISVLRLAGATNIAKALRSTARRPVSALGLLGV